MIETRSYRNRILFLVLILGGVVLHTALHSQQRSSGALKKRIQLLKRLSFTEKRKLVRELRRTIRPRHLPVLVNAIRSVSDPSHGKTILRLISYLKTRKAGQVLIKLARNHPMTEIRVHALKQLFFLRDPRAQKIFFTRVRSDQVPFAEKKQLIRHLRLFATIRPELRKNLRSFLTDLTGSPRLQKELLKFFILGKYGTSLNLLRNQFQSEHETVKMWAAFGLYREGTREPVSYLNEQLIEGKVPKELQVELFNRVKKREDEAFVPVIFNMLSKNKGKLKYRPHALVSVIGEVGKAKHLRELRNTAALYEDRWTVRKSFTDALLKIASLVSIDKLKTFLHPRKDSIVRVKTAELLHLMDQQSGNRALLKFLKQDETRLQKKALQVLRNGKVSLYRSIPVLIRLLDAPSKDVRYYAYKALKTQVPTFYPYQPLHFEKVSYVPDAPAPKRRKKIQTIRRWWKKHGGLDRVR